MATAAIAFLGMGVMGSAMAANLAKAQTDTPIKIWNRSGDRPSIQTAIAAGAVQCHTIAEAAADASIIFTCLGDVPDVKAVLLGSDDADGSDNCVASYAPSGCLVVDTSTIGPTAARDIAQGLRDRKQIRFLDAPISGGDIGAKKGTLTIMVGGDRADFDEALPWLEIMGANITLCGPVGSGQAVKLCNQVLCAGHMMSLCEALNLAKTQGLNPNLVVEVCSTGAAGSWALANLGPKIIESDFAPGFAIEHMVKDLRLVLENLELAAKSDGGDRPQLPFPVTQWADRCFQQVEHMDSGNGRLQGTQAAIRAYHASPASDSLEFGSS
ncbi:MAG: NAD(P)-dependent oxidoreductase [Cyanobacteria bacterium P01_D01_bin.73]